MPIPSTVPSQFQLEAMIRPRPNAFMRNASGSVVNVRVFCIEKKVTEFKVEYHNEHAIVISAKSSEFFVPWEESHNWELVQAAPERIRTQPWVQVGQKIRYSGTDVLGIRSKGPIVISNNVSSVFTIRRVLTRSMDVEMEGAIGLFEVSLEGDFLANWTPLLGSHDPRVSLLKDLRVGSRIMPVNVEGKKLGDISYLVTDRHGQESIEVCALLGDGQRGPTMVMPYWNTGTAWTFAPDDPSLRKLQVGDTVQREGVTCKVVSVDEFNRRIQVERVVQESISILDPELEVVRSGVDQPRGKSRFHRVAGVSKKKKRA